MGNKKLTGKSAITTSNSEVKEMVEIKSKTRYGLWS